MFVGATLTPAARFAQGGVFTIENTTLIPYWAAYCTVRS